MYYKLTGPRKGNVWVFINLLTMPVIWAPLPLAILTDLAFEFYHRVCFPIYGIEYVKRKDYIQVLDRNKLKYLSWYKKLGCMYCGYINGCLLYLKEIAGRTEAYWCGIMHEGKPGFKVQEHQVRQAFAGFGDQKEFEDKFVNDTIISN